MKRAAILISLLLGAAAPAAVAADGPDPLVAELTAMEQQSWQAWQDHDGAFYDRFLSPDHVEVGFGGGGSKAEVVALVASGRCTVKSWSTDHFTLTRFDNDTALLVYHAVQDTTCGAFHVPSPVWVSSLYVLRDGQWTNLVYQQTAVPGA